MKDTFLLANSLLFLILWFLSLALFYFVVKVAVRNGVQQATSGLIESVIEIKLATSKKGEQLSSPFVSVLLTPDYSPASFLCSKFFYRFFSPA